MTAAAPPIACHGKLPTGREYVHHQAGGLDVAPLDQWVQTGHRHAFAGDGPTAAYDRSSAFGFVFPTESGPSLQGVMHPSHDATRRRYPFWVAWQPAAPSLHQSLFVDALSFAERAVRGDLLPRSLGRHVDTLRLSRRAGAAPSFGRKPLDRLLPASSSDDPQAHLRVLGTWLHTLLDRSASALRRLQYGLQLPLPRDGTALDAAAFWLDATRMLVDDRAVPLTLFWSLPPAYHLAAPDETSGRFGSSDAPASDAPASDAPGTARSGDAPPEDAHSEGVARPLPPDPVAAASGFLLLFTTTPPPHLYAHLFDPGADRSFVYAPARVAARHADEALSALPPRLREALATSRSAGDLLATLR